MFENLSERLERSFKLLKGQGRITELNVAETVRDIRRALLDADVSYRVAKDFTDRVREQALGQQVLTSVQPGQLLIKIMHDRRIPTARADHCMAYAIDDQKACQYIYIFLI